MQVDGEQVLPAMRVCQYARPYKRELL